MVDIPQHLLDRAVKAMLAAQRARLREVLVKAPVDPDSLQRFFLELREESERAVAIVAFEYIDDALRSIMLQEFNPMIEGGAEGLFKPFAPLGTANARIKVAGGLHWIASGTYADLETLRRIRNHFAHSPFSRSLNDSRVSAMIEKLTPVEKEPFRQWLLMEPQWVLRKSITLKDLLISRCAIRAAVLISEVATAPTAIRMGLPPGVAVSHNIKEESPSWVYPLFECGLRVAAMLLLVSSKDGTSFGA